MKKLRKKTNFRSEEEEKNETKFGPHPLLEASQPEIRTEHQVSLDQTPITPEAVPQITDTPTSGSQDPKYLPPQTPTSGCEMQTTRIQRPVTRSRASIMPEENVNENTSAE